MRYLVAYPSSMPLQSWWVGMVGMVGMMGLRLRLLPLLILSTASSCEAQVADIIIEIKLSKDYFHLLHHHFIVTTNQQHI